MKKAAIIIGALVLLFTLLIAGLSLYLTDDRLREMVVPELREATGRDVEIERISYTLFRTFPRFGLVIEGLNVPDPREDKLAGVDELLFSLDLIPLVRSEISIHQLTATRPEFTYIIYEDGTTNLDDFFPEEDPEAEPEPAELPDLNLSEIIVTNAAFGMIDYETDTTVRLSDLNLTSALRFADQLESTLDAQLGSLDITLEGRQLVSGLGLDLYQTSVLNLSDELLTLEDGRLNIQGLALTLEGRLSEWSGGEPLIDLQLASESDDFGSLLDLVPPEFEEYTADLVTGGELDVNATFQGRFTETEIPEFNANAHITDGFLHYTELPERISDISLNAIATNELFTMETFEARAGETRFSARGDITDPLDEAARFTFSGLMDADLSTANRYVPLEEFEIEELAGLINVNAEADGPLWAPEEAGFEVIAELRDGRIKHAQIDRPLEEILVDLNATHEIVRLEQATAQSSENNFALTGSLTSPLDPETATFEASGEVNWDLATVREYYPIDTDTLDIRGFLSLNGIAGGRLEDPENATFDLETELTDGYIAWHHLGHPIEEMNSRIHVTENQLSIASAGIRSASNRFTLTGDIREYMEEFAQFDLTLNGLVDLDEINDYYPVEEEFGLMMSGRIDSETRLTGRIDDLEAIQLSGPATAEDVNMDSPDLILPLSDLNGRIYFEGEDIETESVSFLFGESDYYITGRLERFKSLMYEPGEAEPAHYTGSYEAEFLNVDEFMDFEDVPEDPEPFEAWLPNLTGDLDGSIGRLQFFGMEAEEITGRAELNPEFVALHDGYLAIYDGTMEGGFRWDVFARDHTGFTFSGYLQDMRVEELFRDFDLGGRAQLAEYVRANINATTDFYAEFDEYLEPDMYELRANGNFGMDEARVAGHPVQVALADLLRVDDLRDLALDSWTARYDIQDGMMTLDDFNLTSMDLGLNLHGTQNLIEDELDYRADVVLPGRWAERIGSGVLPTGAGEALKREDDKMVIPVTIRGSSENPRPGLDNEEIRNIVEQYLRERAEEEGQDILDGVLRRIQN